MMQHNVKVTVEGRTIRVAPDSLVMTSADEVRWSGAQRFTIEFDGEGPFTSRRLAHDVAAAPQTPRRKGRFKYTVALESDPSVQLDPDVVVGDPPSEPNP